MCNSFYALDVDHVKMLTNGHKMVCSFQVGDRKREWERESVLATVRKLRWDIHITVLFIGTRVALSEPISVHGASFGLP